MTFQERKYQTRAKEAFQNWVKSDERLGTVILPTGVGKTATASLCLSTLENQKVLWVAHREELITQAHGALSQIIPDRDITIEMADQKANVDSDIVVGSVQTVSRNRKHFQDFRPDVIVIDEYHHYSEDNVQYDGLLERWPEAKVMGLTATPWRFSGETLPLGKVLIQMDVGAAIEKGYLVPPTPETLISNVSLAEVGTRAGDFEIKGLANAVNADERNLLIVKKVLELVKEHKRQGILFGVNVAHSHALYEMLKNDVRATEVYGDTPIEERRQIMAAIKNGEIDVLCNNLVATEGFDVPHLSFVVTARPTRSLSLFIQMIGRGLRSSPGKTDCIVVDVCDKIKARQSRVSFSDMARAGDIYGDYKRANNVLKAELPVDKVNKTLKNFPVFLRSSRADRWQVDEDSWSVGSWALDESQWIVSWGADTRTPKIVNKPVWAAFDSIPEGINVRGRPVIHEKFGEGVIKDIAERGDEAKVLVTFDWDIDRIISIKYLKRRGFVQEHAPDEFDIRRIERLFYICCPPRAAKGRIVACEKNYSDLIVHEDLSLTRLEIDQYLVEKAKQDGSFVLVRTGAKWKREPATPKQMDLIQKFLASGKIGFDLDLETLSKGDVSAILDQSKWQDLIIKKFGTDSKGSLLGYDVSADDF